MTMHTRKSLIAAGGLAVVATVGYATVHYATAVLATGSGSIDLNGAVIVPGNAPVVGDAVIETAAQLGAPPTVGAWFGQFPSNSPTAETGLTGWIDAGLGGPDFRAEVDMTLPGGVYDFGEFVVDPGVTLTFSGATTIRAAKDVVVEGRLEMTDSSPGDVFGIRSAGDFTLVAHAGEASGIAADGDGATLRIQAFGDAAITAEPGTEAVLSATGDRGAVRVVVYEPQQTMNVADFERVRFRSGNGSSVYVWGPVTLDGCSADGDLVVHAREPMIYECSEDGDCTDGDPRDDAAIVRGGSFPDGLGIYAGAGNITLAEGAEIGGRRCEVFATGFGGGAFRSELRVAGDVRIEVSHHVTLAAGANVDLDGGCVVRTTSASEDGWLIVAGGDVTSVGAGALVEHAGGAGNGIGTLHGSLAIAGNTVRVSGTIRGAGPETFLGANADVVLDGDAVVDGGDGALVIGAHGAVVAVGGNVRIDAGDIDIRCATGDLDLNVAGLEATAGKFAAISNGRVRLRGTYSAARDVQVLSIADVVSVAGATLTTADVTDGLSGFVRLATYGSPTTVIIGGDLPADGEDEDEDEEEEDDSDDGKSAAKPRTDPTPGDRTLINASDATLRTGDSNAQSGSILLQNQAGEGTVAKASIRVVRAAARRRGAEVVTQLRGTISIPRRKLDLTGSGRVTAGTVDERLLLAGGRAALRGEGGAVSLRLTRPSSSRIGFAIDVREPAATAGETARVAFHRAGLHVRGAFRRPRVR